jgi:hypothetical protein
MDISMRQKKVWCFLLHIKRPSEKEQKPLQQATGGEGYASYFRTASEECVQADGSTKQVDSKKLTGNLPRQDTPPVASFHCLEGAIINHLQVNNTTGNCFYARSQCCEERPLVSLACPSAWNESASAGRDFQGKFIFVGSNQVWSKSN